jgi:hypothetical protein
LERNTKTAGFTNRIDSENAGEYDQECQSRNPRTGCLGNQRRMDVLDCGNREDPAKVWDLRGTAWPIQIEADKSQDDLEAAVKEKWRSNEFVDVKVIRTDGSDFGLEEDWVCRFIPMKNPTGDPRIPALRCSQIRFGV